MLSLLDGVHLNPIDIRQQLFRITTMELNASACEAQFGQPPPPSSQQQQAQLQPQPQQQQQTNEHPLATSNQQQQQSQQQQQQQNQQPPYTIPGILHYLEYEWHRFEVERQEWEVEKAELSARIALLQGEKKSHENLRHDLIRRIKMLEYCLRMERAKYHRLEHGTEPPPIECANSTENSGGQQHHHQQQHQQQQQDGENVNLNLEKAQQPQNDDDGFINTNNSSTITYGRELLKHYLQEIGYTDTVIDLRSKNWCPNVAPVTNNKKSETTPVDIGELATLTTLGSEPINTDDSSKKQWTNKYRLQSHYDCVRALRFCEKDSLIITASEDETIKLWHLSRPSSTSSKSRQPSLPPSINAISSAAVEGSTPDIEPLHTYRGHTARILAITTYQDHIFSGAQNGEMIIWKIISDPSTADQYDKFDSSLLVSRFVGHDDAVWSLEMFEHTKLEEPILCSAGADQTIKLWSISGGEDKLQHLLKTITLETSPTCIARMPPYNVYQAGVDIAVSSCDGRIRLYDLTASLNNAESNTQEPTAILECDDSHRINSIVIHPTLPYLASADSNKSIKFWDLKTNTCKLTMVAHLDEVTSLACDPTGKYLLSASHDCSARLWLFEEKSCIQEITSHRKKFDEGIFAVAFHPNLSHFATAGADGLAKVFV